jgi:hypothetical protein
MWIGSRGKQCQAEIEAQTPLRGANHNSAMPAPKLRDTGYRFVMNMSFRPGQGIVGHLFPSGLAEREMRALGIFLIIRNCLGLPIEIVVRLYYRRGRDVVFAAGHEE